MVYHAKVIKKINHDYHYGVQPGLDEIAKTQEFIAVLNQEVIEPGLVLQNVTQCIPLAYSQAEIHAKGNDTIITLSRQHYTADQVAVLAAFLKVQGGWPGGLEWIEGKKMKAR